MTTKGLPRAHLLQQRIAEHLLLEIAGFDLQWSIGRLGELAELPPIRETTDPLTDITRYTKSQKRQLSLFEIIQGRVNSLTTSQPKKSKRKAKISESQHRPPLRK
jgi:hypothetical protein